MPKDKLKRKKYRIVSENRNKIPVALMYLPMSIKTTFFVPKQMRFEKNSMYCSFQIKEKAL